MAVKKTETAVQDTEAAKKDTMDTQEKDTEVIHLFKDSQRYKAPVFVGVNPKGQLLFEQCVPALPLAELGLVI